MYGYHTYDDVKKPLHVRQPVGIVDDSAFQIGDLGAITVLVRTDQRIKEGG